MIVLYVLVVMFLASTAWAQEKPKGPTCQEQLNEVTVQAYNLDSERDKKERDLAQSQVKVYQLQQQVTQLQKTIADMKKVGEPKAEEKPKE